MSDFIFFEQYNRMKRFLERIKTQNRNQIEYEDDIWAFFQNAWHLKDWIQNDDAFKTKNNINIDNFLKNGIEQSTNLQICRDIANQTKHLRLKPENESRKKISTKNITKEINKDIELRLGGPVSDNLNVYVKYNYRFKSIDGIELNVLDLANNIVTEWGRIIDRLGPILKQET